MLNFINEKFKKNLYIFLLIWIALGPAIPEIFPSIRRKFLLIQDWRMFTDTGNGWCKVDSESIPKINLKNFQGYQPIFLTEEKCVLFYKNLKANYPNLTFSMKTMSEDGWLISK